MTVSEQYGIAASKGSQVLWLIKRNVMYGKPVNYTIIQSSN